MNQTVPTFRAIEWGHIEGRGNFAIVECDVERDRECSCLHGPVIIDDKPYECVGVERHLLGFPIQPGERIGLWVRQNKP